MKPSEAIPHGWYDRGDKGFTPKETAQIAIAFAKAQVNMKLIDLGMKEHTSDYDFEKEHAEWQILFDKFEKEDFNG